MRVCSVPGCTNPHDAKGYCKSHYHKAVREANRANREPVTCKQAGCKEVAYGLGLCKEHYLDYKNPDRHAPKRQPYRKVVVPISEEERKIRKRNHNNSAAGRAASINSRVRRAYPNTPGVVTVERVAELLATECCVRCGLEFAENNPLHIDHIVPLSRGGTNYDQNLQALCRSCNDVKHNKTEEELDNMLRRMLRR